MKSYAVFSEIASGSMGTVYFGTKRGGAGFSRVVVLKKMHRALLGSEDAVAMFIDEAWMGACVHHPSVVATLDVVLEQGEPWVVMEYVHGQSLLALLRLVAAKGERVPPSIATSIACDVLSGLHAAHHAMNARGEALGLVHRDVSPANVLVGVDGVARVTDFGVAKARGRLQATRDGSIKGKLAYMPPEQLHGEELDGRVDVYAAGVVLWEMLAGTALFAETSADRTIEQVLHGSVPPLHEIDADLASFDDVLKRALDRTPENRFETAQDMVLALERIATRAPASEVGAWVESTASAQLEELGRALAIAESAPSDAPDRALRAERPRPRRSRRLRGIGGALAVGAAAVAIAMAGTSVRRRDVRVPEPLPARSSSESESVAAPPAESAAPPSPTFSVPVAPRSIEPMPALRRQPAPRVPPTKPDCSMPFTVDGEGHKHFRPECG
ncbi:MAG: eukaryotic-like serine/threonine-protein kinase [Myxococcales bacterium]|nr:eukaryotic-like serine/threonine-protein kinase [Myxococcales bacterium]